MLSHKNFNDHLVEELRHYRPFSLYWNDALSNCVPTRMVLEYEPTETLGYYKDLMCFDMSPRDQVNPLIRHTVAHCDLLFTSTCPQFDFERALQVDEICDGEIHAVNVCVRISDLNHYSLGTFRKRLWGQAPPYVEGAPTYIQLLI